MTKQEFNVAREKLREVYEIIYDAVERDIQATGDSRNKELADDLELAMTRLYKYGVKVSYIKYERGI